MIPYQLMNEKYRFILIRSKDKKPFELGWQQYANYKYNDQKILKHISSGGNYGVLTGVNDLIVLDIEKGNEQTIEKIKTKLPKTFTIKTGGGGYHFYYKCPELKEKIILENGNGHIGEIQTKGQQVIGPGSTHPSGEKYFQLNEEEIKQIPKEKIIETLKNEIKKIKQKKFNPGTTRNINISCTDVIPLSGLEKKPSGEYQGPHPKHGSDNTGANFTLNPSKDVWHCFRHNCGGNALTWIGIQEDIIECGDTPEKKQWAKIFTIAKEKYGYIPEEEQRKEIEQKQKQTHNKEIKIKILNHLIDKEKNEATEILTTEILNREKIVTLRDDNNTEMWYYKEGIYQKNAQTRIKEIGREILGEQLTSHFINNVIFKIETDTYIDQKEFFDKIIKDKIVVQNGILNLETFELEPFDKEKKFFTKLPITYDPDAQCPNIIQFFKDVLKYDNDIEVIQELFGYCLYKEYFIEKAIMLIGSGRNGKGKTIEILKRFLGPQNCTGVPLQQLEKDIYATAELHTKLANLSGDIDYKALEHTGKFKNLTGRDSVTANRKYLSPIYFENYAKMVFAANTLPRTHDITEAFFMRWVLLEFPYTFVTQEEIDNTTDYKEKQRLKLRNPKIIENITTEEELSGLLNWAIIGLKRLKKNRDFSYNKSNKDVQQTWMRKSDSFTAFCMDHIEEAYGFEMKKSEVRHLYNNYCKKNKLKVQSDKSLKYTLTTMFGSGENRHLIDGERVFYWTNIKFKENDTNQKTL